MFIIDATFEDCRIQANSETGENYNLQVSDNHKGTLAPKIVVTALQLSHILQFNLDNNGEPEGFEKMYESLEPLIKDWPIHLRPIP